MWSTRIHVLFGTAAGNPAFLAAQCGMTRIDLFTVVPVGLDGQSPNGSRGSGAHSTQQ
jgi:hypothetical protein